MSERTIARLEAAYSTASAESVAKVVTEGYALAPLIECSLLHRGFNDSFEIKTANNQRYMLRISCRRPRGEADVASETAFLAYLDSVGAPVATPAPARNGALFMLAHLPEGWRPIVLFHYSEGRDPKADSPADARAQGIALACIHAAADRYADRDQCRYRLDLDHLLHRQLATILEIPDLPSDARTDLTELAFRLSESVSAMKALSWTRCHGDCHGGNARIGENGAHAGKAIFYDFDDGGPGYLAYDLAVYLWSSVFLQNRHGNWRAFVQGYNSIRSIAQADLDAAHVFVAIRHIWLMGEYAGRRAEWGRLVVRAAWIKQQCALLRAWESDKLSTGLFDR